MLLEEVRSLYKLAIPEGSNVLVYGTGEAGIHFFRQYIRTKKLNCLGFYTSNPRGRSTFLGRKLLTRSELESLDRNTVIIAAVYDPFHYQEIVLELHQLGFKNIFTPREWLHLPNVYQTEEDVRQLAKNREEIEKVYALLEDEKSKYVFEKLLEYRRTNNISIFRDIFEKSHPQYFPLSDIFVPEEDEVLIDGGCLDCDTIDSLKKWTQDQYRKVYAFEPSHEDYLVVKEIINRKNYRADAIEAGLYSSNRKMSFELTETLGANHITENGMETIEVVALDTFLKDKTEKITFIKMDIEGSELEALNGAVNTLQSHHPKLAISIYHKFDDLWKIPLWIHERFPGYRLYIRHHSYYHTETILYARYER